VELIQKIEKYTAFVPYDSAKIKQIFVDFYVNRDK